MRATRFDVLVSKMCAEIDELHAELSAAREDARHWREKYAELVERDIKHGEHMIGGILALALAKECLK